MLNFILSDIWRSACLILTLLLLLAFGYIRTQHYELKKAKLAYENPQVVEKTKYVKVQGPVRVVTKVVEVEGRKETVKEVVKEGAVTSSEGWAFSQPLFEPKKPPKRWILGAGMLGLGPLDVEYMGYGGITLFDRVDFCIGATTEGRGLVLGNFRF